MPNRVEEMGAKAMGKAKQAKAGMQGLKGVFRTLAEQHGEVSALLVRAKASHDAAKRSDLWQKIRAELLSHERAEMREVYPEIAEHQAGKSLAEHHDTEASELESMIERMEQINPASSEWMPMLKRIADTVQHHAKEEESEIFPKAQEIIGEEAAKRLDGPFTRTKAQIMKQV